MTVHRQLYIPHVRLYLLLVVGLLVTFLAFQTTICWQKKAIPYRMEYVFDEPIFVFVCDMCLLVGLLFWRTDICLLVGLYCFVVSANRCVLLVGRHMSLCRIYFLVG